jgi:signal peptidase II
LSIEAQTLATRFRKLRYLLVSLAVVVLDQWTKWLVEVHLPHHTTQPVIPGLFNLTHVRNSGVAFGLFASNGGGWLLTALGLSSAWGPWWRWGSTSGSRRRATVSSWSPWRW